ncbi:MAG: spore germination protein, partial [Clostridia bacterium]|nr:spore germination protein [Clostridia bacterium]
LPGLFIAITLFHEEMLPTYLLYAISASRQNVPFPSIIELLLMELAFEMIREAGVRMPGPLGSILGIVGGLILGQAAVSAKIVSPIMIIIVAITGIGSFATADYSLGWSYRILKIIFILLGGSFGFFGIAMGIFIYSVLIASTKSFGVPFLSPLPGNKLYKNAVFVPPIWQTEKRPGYLKPKKLYREDKISKKWRVGR